MQRKKRKETKTILHAVHVIYTQTIQRCGLKTNSTLAIGCLALRTGLVSYTASGTLSIAYLYTCTIQHMGIHSVTNMQIMMNSQPRDRQLFFPEAKFS